MRRNFQQMRQYSEITRVQPSERIKKLLNLNQRFRSNENCLRIFQENRMVLDRELVSVTGRQLEPQKLTMDNNDLVELNHENRCDWTNLILGKKMYKANVLKGWIFMCPRSIETECLEFLTMMIDVGKRMGMTISEYTKVALPDDHIRTYLRHIDECLLKDPSFIVIVLEKNLADHYAAIKKRCCCATNSQAVPTQIILKKTIDARSRSIMSVATKIAIQINCKLGGIPWIVTIPLNGLLVIGFDVTQDSQNKRKTYGAMVAHIDPKDGGGSFYSCVSHHEYGEQISATFGTNVVGVVNQYLQIKNTLPRKIIIYRDGVGDGQIEYVFNNEVKDVIHKLNGLYRMAYDEDSDPIEKRPQISFVVINKRINTRFFYK